MSAALLTAMRSIIRGSIALIAAWGVLIAAAPVAVSSTNPSVLHLNFRRVASLNGHCGPEVSTSGSYTLASLAGTSEEGCATEFLLLNDRTGKRAVIRPTGASDLLAFGAPWILFSGTQTDKLYNIDTRKWRSLCAQGACVPGDTIGYEIGSQWLQFDVQQDCGNGVQSGDCGPVTHSFFNLRSGEDRTISPPSTEVVDLNSPTLAHRACAPLSVPSNGSLTFYGSYAVTDRPTTPARGSFFLERCGSHANVPIDASAGGPISPVIGNAHAVLWQPLATSGQWSGGFSGIFLSDSRRFTAQTPSSIPIAGLSGGTVRLDSFRIYLTDVDGQLWSAPFPTSSAKTAG